MAVCKLCGSEKQGINCSLCRQRSSQKFKLIDWEATKTKFGYHDNHVLQKPDVIIITCQCGESKEVLWRSIRAHSSLCRSCTSKELWRSEEYKEKLDSIMQSDEYKDKHQSACRADEHRARLSESSKRNWEDNGYRDDMIVKIREFVKTDNYIAKQSEQSRLKWQREDYRHKQAAGAKRKNTIEFCQKISEIVSAYWTEERKDNASVQAEELWEDVEYRAKTTEASKTAMQDPEVRQAISDRTREYFSDISNRQYLSGVMLALWADPEYRERMSSILSESSKRLWATPNYREKVVCAATAGIRRLWDNQELSAHLRKACSERSRALWADPDYRKITIDALAERMREVWADPEHRERMSSILSESSKRSWTNPKYRERMAKVRASQLGCVSSIQRQLYKYLTDLGVGFSEEGPETRIGYYVFDCLVPKCGSMGKSLLIECQGDYWHSLQRAQSNDRAKFTYVDRYFPDYEIMYVWEREFYAKDRVLDRLKLKLGLELNTIDFDFGSVELREVSGSDIRSFLDAYHYIGKGRGGKCLGAFLNNNLIACVVFSSPLRQNTAGQFDMGDGEVRELSRLCIHPSYHKKNFASWLIARSIKLSIDCKLVIAYADRTVGHTGTIYKASGFNLHHTVPANYWYVDKDGYVMHKRTLYGKARQMKMTENEYVSNYGYTKKWGGDKQCFVREII